jgi:mannose-6-phosphate isomerase-like protein (cupin superfamily)
MIGKSGADGTSDRVLFHQQFIIRPLAPGLIIRWSITFSRLSIRLQKRLKGRISMNRIATTISIAAAFAAGCGVTHLLRPALAADNITAQVIHTGELEGDTLSAANPAGMRNKLFVAVDGATIAIQDGNTPKHLHPNANEIQYILEGTGTIWLGDKEVKVKPGDLVIIPHGTPHGGSKPDGRTLKAITIKTPPQTPDDVKLLN